MHKGNDKWLIQFPVLCWSWEHFTLRFKSLIIWRSVTVRRLLSGQVLMFPVHVKCPSALDLYRKDWGTWWAISGNMYRAGCTKMHKNTPWTPSPTMGIPHSYTALFAFKELLGIKFSLGFTLMRICVACHSQGNPLHRTTLNAPPYSRSMNSLF